MIAFRAALILAIQSILFFGCIGTSMACGDPNETCCTDYAVKGEDGTFKDGRNQICQASSQCPTYSQGPRADGSCQPIPNKNRIPACPKGTYCCVKYTQPIFQKGSNYMQRYPGFDLTCQAVGTGCPDFFQGFGTADCSEVYPNYNVQPVYDCPAGQKCCWTKPRKWIDGTYNDKVIMTCVGIKEDCPLDLKSEANLKCPRT